MKKKFSLARFFDEYALAGKGLLLATRRKDFWITFAITFVVFGTLINMLSTGFASFSLMWGMLTSGNVLGALKVLWSAFLAIFGVGRELTDFLLNFVLIILQAVLISLVVIVAKHNKKNNGSLSGKVRRKKSESEESESEKEKKKSDTAGIESSAIVAGLAVLGSGCPTCGTTLISPIIATLLSGTSGAVAIAGTLSAILNVFAILLAVLVFRKLGLHVYAIIKSEEFKEKKSNE